jgi:hypothetical protein
VTAIARYKELEGHPVFKYNVEIIVLTNNKRVKIAEINCKDEAELAQATEWVDFTLKGEEGATR